MATRDEEGTEAMDSMTSRTAQEKPRRSAGCLPSTSLGHTVSPRATTVLDAFSWTQWGQELRSKRHSTSRMP